MITDQNERKIFLEYGWDGPKNVTADIKNTHYCKERYPALKQKCTLSIERQIRFLLPARRTLLEMEDG